MNSSSAQLYVTLRCQGLLNPVYCRIIILIQLTQLHPTTHPSRYLPSVAIDRGLDRVVLQIILHVKFHPVSPTVLQSSSLPNTKLPGDQIK